VLSRIKSTVFIVHTFSGYYYTTRFFFLFIEMNWKICSPHTKLIYSKIMQTHFILIYILLMINARLDRLYGHFPLEYLFAWSLHVSKYQSIALSHVRAVRFVAAFMLIWSYLIILWFWTCYLETVWIQCASGVILNWGSIFFCLGKKLYKESLNKTFPQKKERGIRLAKVTQWVEADLKLSKLKFVNYLR